MTTRGSFILAMTALVIFGIYSYKSDQANRFSIVPTQNGVYVLDRKNQSVNVCTNDSCRLLLQHNKPFWNMFQNFLSNTGYSGYDFLGTQNVCIPQQKMMAADGEKLYFPNNVIPFTPSYYVPPVTCNCTPSCPATVSKPNNEKIKINLALDEEMKPQTTHQTASDEDTSKTEDAPGEFAFDDTEGKQ